MAVPNLKWTDIYFKYTTIITISKIIPIIIAPKYLIWNAFIEITLYMRENNGCYYRRRNYYQSTVSDW